MSYLKELEEQAAREREEAAKIRASIDASQNVARHPCDDPNLVPMPDNLPETDDLKELAQFVEKDVFKTYWVLMNSDKTPAAVRKACADALADRAKGKAAQEINQNVKVEKAEASLEDVARMLAFSMRDAQEKGLVIDVEAETVDDVEHDEKT